MSFQHVIFQCKTRFSPVPNVFGSNVKMRSSLAINAFCVQCDIVFAFQRCTGSSLVINVFVCSVMSYSEVSSRDSLVTSNKRVSYSEVKFQEFEVRSVFKGRLLFLLACLPCGYNSRCGYYSRCSFYSRKYSICYGTVYSLIYYLF